MNLSRHPVNLGFAMVLHLSFAAYVPANAQEKWDVTVAPYAWLSGIDGDLGTIPGFPTQSVSFSFSDILDDLEYGGFLFVSARKHPWVLYFDASTVKISATETIGGALINNFQVDSKTSNIALAVGRTISSSNGRFVDVYAGARAWWLDNAFVINTALGSATASGDANWIDPIVGISARSAVNEKWGLFGSAEIGGFGVGADSEWSVQIGAEYKISDRFAMNFGWRHMSVDYDDGEIIYDAVQSGPLVGAAWKF